MRGVILQANQAWRQRGRLDFQHAQNAVFTPNRIRAALNTQRHAVYGFIARDGFLACPARAERLLNTPVPARALDHPVDLHFHRQKIAGLEGKFGERADIDRLNFRHSLSPLDIYAAK